jgi:hypothetical protein
MPFYDKDKLKESLELEQVYDLLELWGGEPEYTDSGLIAQTICHNRPGEGSRKLYYYQNTRLFHCYTGCIDPSFDCFDLAIKIAKIQKNEDWELFDAMDYIAHYFGLEGEEPEKEEEKLEDWEIFKRHVIVSKEESGFIQLKEYNPVILTRFSYPRILGWEREGILPEVSRKNLIGYYAGGDQITIPHFDIDGRFVGLRGRFLAEEQANRYGKYMPLKIGKQQYNHPLSMNLYNLNNSKENVKHSGTAIVFESEKSCLMMQSYYGIDNDISVAVCGSSLSAYHIKLLKSLGVREVIVALDRQFQEIGDEEFKRLKTKLIYLGKKYGNIIKLSVIFDKDRITGYKASPIDEGPEKFERLLKERFIPQ